MSRPKPPPPSKYSRLWREVPQPGDYVGAYTAEQLERMDQEFTAAVERGRLPSGISRPTAATSIENDPYRPQGCWHSPTRLSGVIVSSTCTSMHRPDRTHVGQ
jgi:hypothetical protein